MDFQELWAMVMEIVNIILAILAMVGLDLF